MTFVSLLLLSMVACDTPDRNESSAALSSEDEKIESFSQSEVSEGSADSSSVLQETSDEESFVEDSSEPEESSEPNDQTQAQTTELSSDLFEEGYFWGQNGEWLYYADENGILLGRVHLDGTNRQKYENAGITSANVEHDRIYYVDINNGKHLYAMEHDGTDVTLLCEDEVGSSYMFPLDIVDGRIYYEANSGGVDSFDEFDIYILCSVKTDGTDRQELGSMDADYRIPEEDGWVYTFVDGYTDLRICRMRPDGSEKTILTDVEVWHFVVDNGWIYYTLPNTSDHSDSVFRIKTDGTENQVFCEDQVEVNAFPGDNIMFSEDNVYLLAYNEEDDQKKLYIIKKDGSGRMQLSTKAVRDLFCTYGDTVFYSAKTGEEWALYAVEADGTNERYICSSASVSSSTLERAVWFIDSGLIYEFNGHMYFYSFEKVN